MDMTRDPPEQITIASAIVGDLKWVRASYEANFGRVAVTWNRRRQNPSLGDDFTEFFRNGSLARWE